MSTFGQRVVAIVEPTSQFALQISSLFTDVAQLTARMDTLTANAPEVLDTLKEIADAINTDPAFFTTMATANTTLQTNIDAEATTRGAAVTALQNLIDAATAARTALSGRLDSLELDPTTATAVATAVAAVQADVDQNESDADAAIAGVQADLATETTARGVAIAALQADVDQNEADADAAIALRAPIASPAFTGNLITHIGSADHPVVHRIQGGFPDINLRTNGSDVDLNQNEGRLLWEDAGGGAVAAIKQTMLPDAPMRFFTGGITASDESMRILANGRVGIGNTNPQAQLHIAGSALVQADFPDFQMRSGGEKRLIFEDNGGGALAAIKCAGQHMKLFAGGVAASDQIAEVNSSGLTIESGKTITLEGTAITATGAELNQLDGVTLGTAATAATGDFATAAQGAKADSALQAHQDISGKANLSGATFTGNIEVSKNWPDVTLKSGDEKRLLFSDAGGAATGGIKHVSTSLDFYASGIASGNKEFSVKASGVEVTNGVTLTNGLTDASDDAAAALAGVAVGQLYRNGSVVMIRVS